MNSMGLLTEIKNLFFGVKESAFDHNKYIQAEKNFLYQDVIRKVVNSINLDYQTLSDELYGETQPYKLGLSRLPIDRLRRIAKTAYWDSSTAGALIDRITQIVVGAGLRLQATPAWSLIPFIDNTDNEFKQNLKSQIEIKFKIWSQSKRIHYQKEFDLDRFLNYAFFLTLYEGEVFVVFRYNINGDGRNPLSLEFINPDRLKATTSLSQVGKNNVVEDGIEYNSKNEAVAYHIIDEISGTSQRIPKYGPRSNRLLVYHNYKKINHNQRRGVPELVGSIKEFTQLADFQSLEIKAAAINALIAIWIEPPEDEDGRPVLSNKIHKKEKTVVDPETGESYVSQIKRGDIEAGGLLVENLPRGHKLRSYDTSRPNAEFEKFFTAVKRNIAARHNVPLSVVDYNFATQYSSARGELIVFWYKVLEWRKSRSADLANEIYKEWLKGEVAAGKLFLPGFDDPELRDAWAFAQWIGSSRPDIDPLKSANAHEKEAMHGWKTNQHITLEREGGDFDDNIERLKSENEALADAIEELLRVQKTTYSNTKSESTSTTTANNKGDIVLESD